MRMCQRSMCTGYGLRALHKATAVTTSTNREDRECLIHNTKSYYHQQSLFVAPIRWTSRPTLVGGRGGGCEGLT